jgi:glutathione synthase/RimK-type ligase-like ATP-grasp enzyme
VILLFGIASEPPLAMVADELRALDAPFALLHQRRWEDCHIVVDIGGEGIDGHLRMGPLDVPLCDVRSIYLRPMDDRVLPDLASEPDGSLRRRRCRELHDAIHEWCEVTPAMVVNRARVQASNASKPYQGDFVRAHGLLPPPTLITNDPDEVHAFRAIHGRVVFKSASGVRSIVHTLTDDDLRRLDRIRWCPVQFQAFVPGNDVRVHCVGTEVFASRITSNATDYRYATSMGEAAEVVAHDIDADLAARCLALTRALGLEVSGIDLRIGEGSEVYCFEVNPSPAYSYYELHTGQPIARALARHLAAA